MLIARAPLCISFGDGGTDLEAYYVRYGRLVISVLITKYFYAIITTNGSDDLQVISADYRSLFRHSTYNDLFWDGDLALPKAIWTTLAFGEALTCSLLAKSRSAQS